MNKGILVLGLVLLALFCLSKNKNFTGGTDDLKSDLDLEVPNTDTRFVETTTPPTLAPTPPPTRDIKKLLKRISDLEKENAIYKNDKYYNSMHEMFDTMDNDDDNVISRSDFDKYYKLEKPEV